VTALLERIQNAVLRVGNGRGFVFESDAHRYTQRYVLTAAHCLPRYPAPNRDWSSAYKNLLGPLGRKRRTIWAECIFVDPVADVAILGSPDNQELWQQATAYEMLMEAATPLSLGCYEAGPVFMMSRDTTNLVSGVPRLPGMVMWIPECDGPIQGGMSGSPIVTLEGVAVSLVSLSSGTKDIEEHTECGPSPVLSDRLPAWLASSFASVGQG
jgi:hypothetical protein